MSRKIKLFATEVAEVLFGMRSQSESIIGFAGFTTSELDTPNSGDNVPINFINGILNNPKNINEIKTLIKESIVSYLTENPNDYKNSKGEYEYQTELYDHSYIVDTYLAKQYEDTHIRKTLWLCSNCESDNVEQKSWVNMNTETARFVNIDGEITEYYCNDCKEHHFPYEKKMKYTTEIIGYQVVGEDDTDCSGRIHDDMEASFCVYSLKQATEMLMNSTEGDWKISTIWSDFITEPTIMFEGKAKDL